MASQRCPECGAPRGMSSFRNECVMVQHAGRSETLEGLAGKRCQFCRTVVFDPPSAERYAAASDRLVLLARREQGGELRRIRHKLGLTQQRASRLTGGGHNAFSRYERGEVPPLPAVLNLFRLLDRHPNLLAELEQTGSGKAVRQGMTRPNLAAE